MSEIRVSVVSPLGYTGLAYYDYSLCESLSANGMYVQLYTSDEWLLTSYSNSFELLKMFKQCSGHRPKILKGINYLKSYLGIIHNILRSKVNIVHFQIVELPPIDLCALLILKLFGKKIVFTPHDIDHNKNYRFNNVLIKFMYRFSDSIIVHKKANAVLLEEKYDVAHNKILITRHGGYQYFVRDNVDKDESRTRLNLPLDQKIILFFGTIKEGKGLDVLLPALNIFLKRMSTACLVIAGKPIGTYSKERLFEEIENNNVSKACLVRCEFIPDKDIQYYYQAADIVVLPYSNLSESGVIRYAQTCGCVVVCSDHKEFLDSVDHGVTGFTFRSGDSAALADTMYLALTSPDRRRISKNAKNLVWNNYSWEKISAETSVLYSSLLSQN